MGDFKATDIFGGGLRNVMKQGEARKKVRSDLKADIAEEKRKEEAQIRKEERDAERQLEKEIREADRKKLEATGKIAQTSAEKLEETTEKLSLFDSSSGNIVSSIPEGPGRDLLKNTVSRQRASIESGGSLDSAFDDIRSVRKDILDPGGTESRKILRINNPELAAKLDAQDALAKGAGGAELQRSKAQESLGRDFLRVNSVIDTTMDVAFDFGEEQLSNIGTKPGAFLGLVDKFTPDQINRYKAAWRGAGNESSATVGRFLIPGARGASLTRIFAESAAEVGNTIEGNASNISFSKGNLFATALSNNIKEINEAGEEVFIQDLMKDPKTGVSLSKLPLQQRINAINAIKTRFVKENQRHIETQAFLRNPNLLQQKTIVKLTKNAPSFSSKEAVDKALVDGQIMPGTLVKVKGRLGVSR